ncbi:unnamed protein product [Pleuronectes platessa]|uniref:Uncharacterized protein n=1 Tax=Pleuronectes platessa TaxID=8262 RepID=A0A9N7Z558_PLEPL|nr:unnamed protein product [Pleuronectes platessa]
MPSPASLGTTDPGPSTRWAAIHGDMSGKYLERRGGGGDEESSVQRGHMPSEAIHPLQAGIRYGLSHLILLQAASEAEQHRGSPQTRASSQMTCYK